jgi:F0F1-type ATP synthase membrane subunit b/b'
MENLLLLSVSLNTDIFEANLINIVLLVVLLFNVVGDALKTSMLERKEKILSGVQDAEQRLNEASERLNEAKNTIISVKACH